MRHEYEIIPYNYTDTIRSISSSPEASTSKVHRLISSVYTDDEIPEPERHSVIEDILDDVVDRCKYMVECRLAEAACSIIEEVCEKYAERFESLGVHLWLAKGLVLRKEGRYRDALEYFAHAYRESLDRGLHRYLHEICMHIAEVCVQHLGMAEHGRDFAMKGIESGMKRINSMYSERHVDERKHERLYRETYRSVAHCNYHIGCTYTDDVQTMEKHFKKAISILSHINDRQSHIYLTIANQLVEFRMRDEARGGNKEKGLLKKEKGGREVPTGKQGERSTGYRSPYQSESYHLNFKDKFGKGHSKRVEIKDKNHNKYIILRNDMVKIRNDKIEAKSKIGGFRFRKTKEVEKSPEERKINSRKNNIINLEEDEDAVFKKKRFDSNILDEIDLDDSTNHVDKHSGYSSMYAVEEDRKSSDSEMSENYPSTRQPKDEFDDHTVKNHYKNAKKIETINNKKMNQLLLRLKSK